MNTASPCVAITVWRATAARGSPLPNKPVAAQLMNEVAAARFYLDRAVASRHAKRARLDIIFLMARKIIRPEMDRILFAVTNRQGMDFGRVGHRNGSNDNPVAAAGRAS